MRLRTVTTLLLVFAAGSSAQDRMADALRKGILEEDSRQNLNAAIQEYQGVLKHYGEARETAATALFRMAECYRKQGKRGPATYAYQRVVKEFADQTKLVEKSRGILASTYGLAEGGLENPVQTDMRSLADRLKQMQMQQNASNAARVRQKLAAEKHALEAQLSQAREQQKAELEQRIDKLKSDLAAINELKSAPATR